MQAAETAHQALATPNAADITQAELLMQSQASLQDFSKSIELDTTEIPILNKAREKLREMSVSNALNGRTQTERLNTDVLKKLQGGTHTVALNIAGGADPPAPASNQQPMSTLNALLQKVFRTKKLIALHKTHNVMGNLLNLFDVEKGEAKSPAMRSALQMQSLIDGTSSPDSSSTSAEEARIKVLQKWNTEPASIGDLGALLGVHQAFYSGLAMWAAEMKAAWSIVKEDASPLKLDFVPQTIGAVETVLDWAFREETVDPADSTAKVPPLTQTILSVFAQDDAVKTGGDTLAAVVEAVRTQLTNPKEGSILQKMEKWVSDMKMDVSSETEQQELVATLAQFLTCTLLQKIVGGEDLLEQPNWRVLVSPHLLITFEQLADAVGSTHQTLQTQIPTGNKMVQHMTEMLLNAPIASVEQRSLVCDDLANKLVMAEMFFVYQQMISRILVSMSRLIMAKHAKLPALGLLGVLQSYSDALADTEIAAQIQKLKARGDVELTVMQKLQAAAPETIQQKVRRDVPRVIQQSLADLYAGFKTDYLGNLNGATDISTQPVWLPFLAKNVTGLSPETADASQKQILRSITIAVAQWHATAATSKLVTVRDMVVRAVFSAPALPASFASEGDDGFDTLDSADILGEDEEGEDADDGIEENVVLLLPKMQLDAQTKPNQTVVHTIVYNFILQASDHGDWSNPAAEFFLDAAAVLPRLSTGFTVEELKLIANWMKNAWRAANRPSWEDLKKEEDLVTEFNIDDSLSSWEFLAKLNITKNTPDAIMTELNKTRGWFMDTSKTSATRVTAMSKRFRTMLDVQTFATTTASGLRTELQQSWALLSWCVDKDHTIEDANSTRAIGKNLPSGQATFDPLPSMLWTSLNNIHFQIGTSSKLERVTLMEVFPLLLTKETSVVKQNKMILVRTSRRPALATSFWATMMTNQATPFWMNDATITTITPIPPINKTSEAVIQAKWTWGAKKDKVFATTTRYHRSRRSGPAPARKVDQELNLLKEQMVEKHLVYFRVWLYAQWQSAFDAETWGAAHTIITSTLNDPRLFAHENLGGLSKAELAGRFLGLSGSAFPTFGNKVDNKSIESDALYCADDLFEDHIHAPGNHRLSIMSAQTFLAKARKTMQSIMKGDTVFQSGSEEDAKVFLQSWDEEVKPLQQKIQTQMTSIVSLKKAVNQKQCRYIGLDGTVGPAKIETMDLDLSLHFNPNANWAFETAEWRLADFAAGMLTGPAPHVQILGTDAAGNFKRGTKGTPLVLGALCLALFMYNSTDDDVTKGALQFLQKDGSVRTKDELKQALSEMLELMRPDASTPGASTSSSSSGVNTLREDTMWTTLIDMMNIDDHSSSYSNTRGVPRDLYAGPGIHIIDNEITEILIDDTPQGPEAIIRSLDSIQNEGRLMWQFAKDAMSWINLAKANKDNKRPAFFACFNTVPPFVTAYYALRRAKNSLNDHDMSDEVSTKYNYKDCTDWFRTKYNFAPAHLKGGRTEMEDGHMRTHAPLRM